MEKSKFWVQFWWRHPSFGPVVIAKSKFWSIFCGELRVFDGGNESFGPVLMEKRVQLTDPPFGKLEKSIGKLKIFCGKLGSWGCNSGSDRLKNSLALSPWLPNGRDLIDETQKKVRRQNQKQQGKNRRKHMSEKKGKNRRLLDLRGTKEKNLPKQTNNIYIFQEINCLCILLAHYILLGQSIALHCGCA